MIRQRVSAFFLLAGVGGTIFSVFVVNLAVTAISRWLVSHHLSAAILLSSIDSVITVSLNALAFAVLYRCLPKRPVQWQAALRGGLLISCIWEAGRQILASFVVGMHYSTAYGTIGAFIGLLLWFYWGVALLLYGAEYVCVLSRRAKRGNLLTTAAPAQSTGQPLRQSGKPPAAARPRRMAA